LQSKKECGKYGAVMGNPLVECRLGSSLHYSSIQAKYPKNFQRTIWEVNVPDTSSSSHGTATGEVRHYHNRGSRTFYIGLYRASHKSGIKLTSSEHPRRTFIQAPMQSIFKILMPGHLEDFSTGSPQDLLKDLYEIMQGPTGFHPGLFKSFSQGLHKIMQRPDGISQGSPQDPFRRACKRR
jgi:hypothetical protein